MFFMIGEKGRVVGQAAGGFEFGLHISDHPLNGLKFADGFAERAALFGIFNGFIESALSQADRLRSNADAAAVQSAESNLQALTLFAEAVGRGYFTIVQQDFDGW